MENLKEIAACAAAFLSLWNLVRSVREVRFKNLHDDIGRVQSIIYDEYCGLHDQMSKLEIGQDAIIQALHEVKERIVALETESILYQVMKETLKVKPFIEIPLEYQQAEQPKRKPGRPPKHG